jgi:antitoxin VapB
MTVAKVFMNRRSQAIRLPKEFRVKGSQVYLKKVPEGVLIVPRDPWEFSREACKEPSGKFLTVMAKRKRLPDQRRNFRGVFP